MSNTVTYWRVDEYSSRTSEYCDGVSESVTTHVRYHHFKSFDGYFSPEAYDLFDEIKENEEGAILLQSQDGFNWIESRNTRPEARISALEGRVTELERLIESIRNG